MMETLRRKPWLLIVAGLVLFVLADLVMLAIAIANPPTLLR